VTSNDAQRQLPAATTLALVVMASLLLKVGLMAYLDGRVYGDVIRSVNFGLGVEQGLISIRTHVDNTKSFVGPLLNALLYHAGGVTAIKLANLTTFLLLCLTTLRLGRGRYPERIVLVALVLLAFYPGGHRNVVAGELEDNVASLVFAVGLLMYLEGRSRLLVGSLMMVGFLVKFWIAIFGGAFGLVLLVQRRWRDALVVTVGGLVPVLLVSLLDHGATVRSLLMTVDRQAGFSSWSTVAFRLLSTGLLPTVLMVGWDLTRRRHPPNGLFAALLLGYFCYVLAFRDAHAVTFVMMLCLVPAGFLVAEALEDMLPPTRRVVALRVILGLYAVAGAGIAWQHLDRDTHPFRVTPGRDAKPVAQMTHRVGGSQGRAT